MWTLEQNDINESRLSFIEGHPVTQEQLIEKSPLASEKKIISLEVETGKETFYVISWQPEMTQQERQPKRTNEEL